MDSSTEVGTGSDCGEQEIVPHVSLASGEAAQLGSHGFWRRGSLEMANRGFSCYIDVTAR